MKNGLLLLSIALLTGFAHSLEFEEQMAAEKAKSSTMDVADEPIESKRTQFPIDFETLVIRVRSGCEVKATRATASNLRAQVECDGVYRIHNWDVNAIGKSIVIAPALQGEDTIIYAYKADGIDWDTVGEYTVNGPIER